MMFVTKKKYKELSKKYEQLQYSYSGVCNTLHDKDDIIAERSSVIERCQAEIHSLEAELETLKSTYADHNTITLTVKDDLTQVVPTVKVKPEVFDKMVELGYLDDHVTSETKSHLMQTAMLVIGAEALEQIVESMSQPVHDD